MKKKAPTPSGDAPGREDSPQPKPPASSPCLLGSEDPGIDPAYNQGFAEQPGGLALESVNTIIYCRNWEATAGFYRGVLGLEINHANDWFIEFRLGRGAFISIANAARSSIKASEGRGLTMALRVADLERAHRFLSGRGARPGPIRQHAWGARVFYLRDPEGNRLEFWTE